MFFEKESYYSSLMALLFLCGSFFILSGRLAAESDEVAVKILISEVSLGGETAHDEFIELYNPNGFAVSLEGWSLKKRSKDGGAEYSNLSSDLGTVRDAYSGKKIGGSEALSIPAFGYFLVVPRMVCGADGNERCYLGGTEPDGYYSVKDTSLAADNSLTLFDADKNEADQVGWGMAADFEGRVIPENIGSGKSLARKTEADALRDSGDNASDFSQTDPPHPQNSKSRDLISNNSSDVPENGTQGSTGEDGSSSGQEAVGSDQEKDAADKSAAEPASASPDPSTGAWEAGRDVVVSELLINPVGEDGKAEFVEIHNVGPAAADLSNWILEDLGGKTGIYIFPAGTELAAGKYLALYGSTTKLSLNNTGDGAVLKDAAGMIVSKSPVSATAGEGLAFVSAGSGWFWTQAPTPGKANVIKEPEGDEKNTAMAAADDAAVSDENIMPAEQVAPDIEDDKADIVPAYDFADGVTISELLPDPAGRDNRDGNSEWVELFNDSGRTVNLKGWCLDDILAKGSKAFCVPDDRLIAAGGYLVLEGGETKVTLNNMEEEVNLLWPDKRMVDHVSYVKAKEGYAYALADGRWSWTAKPTPGKANSMSADSGTMAAAARYLLTGGSGVADAGAGMVLSAQSISEGNDTPSDYETVTVAQAKSLPDGSRACLVGLMSAPLGALGKDVFYISDPDTGDGIQVAVSSGRLPEVVLGDELSLCGSALEVGGEKRLTIDGGSVEKLSSDNALKVLPLDAKDPGRQLGSLVSAEGEVVRVESDKLLFLNLSEAAFKVYAEPETGISFAGSEAGDQLAVTGILSLTSAGFRLLPRFDSDIRALESGMDDGIMVASGKAVSPNAGPFSQSQIIFVLLIGAFLIDWMRMRMKARETGKVYVARRRENDD